MTYFQVVPGQTIGSAHMNAAISQGVPPFANSAARDAAIPTPYVGQRCYLADVKEDRVWMGSAVGGWVHPRPVLQMGGTYPATPPGSLVTLPLNVIDVQRVGYMTALPGTGIRVDVPGIYRLAVAISGFFAGDGVTFTAQHMVNVATAPKTIDFSFVWAGSQRVIALIGGWNFDFFPILAGQPTSVTGNVAVEFVK